jgi:hypothetical protein
MLAYFLVSDRAPNVPNFFTFEIFFVYPSIWAKLEPSPTSKSIGGRDLNNIFDSYCFISSQDNFVSKALTIQFHTTETSFVSDFFSQAKNTLARGVVNCSGEPFQYYIYAVHPDLSQPTTRLIADKGYIMPYGLLKVYGKIYGAKDNLILKFGYYEKIDEPMTDLQWKVQDSLHKNQLEYVEEFSKRADSSFKLE